MNTGQIKKKIDDRHFGFIKVTGGDHSGSEIFFHESALNDIQWDSLQVSAEVSFDVENSPKGLRAVNVSLSA